MPIDSSKLLYRLDFERRTLARHGERLEQLPHLSRLTSPDGSQHTIIFSAFDLQNADRIVSDEISHYRKLDAEFEWKVYSHDAPAGLVGMLEERGFEIGACESVLAVDLLDKHEWLDHPPQHRVERVRTRDEVDLYRQTAEKIFHKNYEFTALELLSGISNVITEHVGYLCFDRELEGAVPVSIGRLHTHAKSAFGGLYGGATLPDYRHTGYYRSLTAARGRDARAMGAKYLIVDALPTSCPILKRLGFVEVSQTWPCVLRRGK